MRTINQTIINELKAITINDVLTSEPMQPTVYIHKGEVTVSAEDGKGFADYWDGMYIDSALEALANKHGLYWDWVNAGSICLAD